MSEDQSTPSGKLRPSGLGAVTHVLLSLLLSSPALAGEFDDWKAPRPSRLDRMSYIVIDNGLEGEDMQIPIWVIHGFRLRNGDHVSQRKAAEIRKFLELYGKHQLR